VRALLLPDAPEALVAACARAGAELVRARSAEEGRAMLARERYELVDGRLARPLSLEGEIRRRIELFYEQLKGHSATGLYQAVLREVERPLIAGALARARGVQADAARVLGIDRGTLARRMRALGVGTGEALPTAAGRRR
jgi:Fis family transcriptional regulator